MKSQFHRLKQLKAYIGSLIIFSFILQSAVPLIATTHKVEPSLQKKPSIQALTANPNNFVVDSNLNTLIQHMVEETNATSNKKISDPLKRCYKTLAQGTQALAIEDVWQAMPDILQYVVDYHTKAPRPNAPITESNAIVGPGTCDTEQLLELLVTIKNRIGCVSDDVCCNTILGILGDACEIFGGDDTISSILIKILDLLETQTACCDQLLETLTILEVIERDVQNTFTVLELIEETLEECCENIIEEIIETRSILIECCEKLNCFPTPLTQADVVGGIIELTEKGNYKFCEDITADLIISNSCISVDMNDRKLFGVVSIHGDDDILKNGFIQPPAPTSLLAAITRVGATVEPAVSVNDGVVNVRLLNLTITNANSIGVDENNNGLPGRDGIFNNGIKTFILDCCIQTGAGSNGGNAQGAPNPLPAGDGGNGGIGIDSIQDKVQIGRTIIMTGRGGNGGTTEIGSPGLNEAGNGGSSGIGIKLFGPILREFNFMGTLARVFDSQVFTGSAGNGGDACCNVGGSGGGSGDGIQNNSQFSEILNTTVRTGNGGDGGAGDSASTGGTGGNSGNAILTRGTQIINVLLSTGNAGNGGNGGIGGTGGSAGHGLFVLDACNTEAREIVVEFTGFGGNGGNSLLLATPGGAGGSGGDAVHITENSKHTEVRNSTFSNTGRGGTGGTGTPAGANGFPGRAVTDLNDDLCSLDPECETEFGPSAIFSNFAYAIGDNDIRYLINGKVKESGKASDKSCNRLDNVYVECNVDVVFDFCQEIGDLLECCTALSNQLEECCDNIRNDIFNTLTILTEEINNISASACRPTPITAPITITESGTYCLAQDIIGTIVVAANNVSIDLNSHQITATSPGIQIQSGFYNISIYNGSITGTVGSTGIEAADSTDIEINDVNFIIDGIGITCNNIKNFIINNTQFTNYTNSSMSFTNCSNGKITNSQIHTNNSSILIPTLTLITLDGCQQLSFNNIIMTDNTNIQTLRGMNGINSSECTFENIQVTSNQATQNFEGLRLENCDDNIIKKYAVNKNSVSSSTNATSLVGINITASVDGGSKNNIITECQINENSNTNTSFTSSNGAVLVGVHIAGTIGGGSINNNACANTAIDNISVNNNICTSPFNNILIGINIAGVINGGSIGTDVCANCTVTNCIITQNTVNGTNSFSVITGINFAGIFSIAASGSIGVNACKNCHITSCDISNNSMGTSTSGVALVCINLGSTITFSGNLSIIINDNACESCSVNNCSLNNNSCGDVNALFTIFVGVNLSSPIGSTVANNGCTSCSINNCTVNNNSNTGAIATFIGYSFAENIISATVGTNVCESCSIKNCTVNNNINNGGNSIIGSSSFIGIGFGVRLPIGSIRSGNNCNNCIVDTISIYKNSITSARSDSFFVGIGMSGIPQTTVGGCNNITCISCLIEANTIIDNGVFNGFLILGTGNNGLTAGCNNIILSTCEVNNNSGLNASNAYTIDGSNGDGIGGANNVQLENCTAKQNISSGTLNGFHALHINNAILSQCVSIANSTNGFFIEDTTDSSLPECEAFNNGTNGFNFSGTTQQVTITNSQALGNLDDGFSFAITTTQCHIRANIAQNNNGIGFDNEGGDINKHQFFSNFAQGNGTNYSGVDLVTSPNLTTGALANAET